MRIERVETIRVGANPNVLFLEIEVEGGLVGLGETFWGAETVEAFIHESAAPYLLGESCLEIERHRRALSSYVGYQGSGAEMRGVSAVDIALWDLLGKLTGEPVYQLLGGRSRNEIPIYNTCAGPGYLRKPAMRAEVGNWGLPVHSQEKPLEDLEAFMSDAGELARDLLDEGIRGMKIWPFDPFAAASNGQAISRSDLAKALRPFEQIRSAVGLDMEIMVELHGLWNLPTAITIARALEPFEPFWIEDAIRPDNIDALAAFVASTPIPVAASETLGGRRSFLELMNKRAVDVVMLDVGWVGGISEAKAIGAMAEAFHLPVAPHDCVGPVVLAASVHLAVNLPNAQIQETVRAYYRGWYQDLVIGLPAIDHGVIEAPTAPGLGITLRPEVRLRDDVTIRSSCL